MMNRRLALQSALSGLAALSLGSLAAAADDKKKATRKPAKANPQTTSLTDKLFVVSGVGGNVVALSTQDGLLLVDTGAAEHARALSGQLKALPGGGKVHTVFNTHWHPEQTGSNAAFGKAGAKIVAHQKTLKWLSTDHWNPDEERYEKALPKTAWPAETFYTTGKTSAGSEQIEYGYLLEAHTDGDIYVYFRDSNVLVVGDALSPVVDPVLDWFGGGWVGGRVDAQDLLLKLCNDQTRIVAGTGPVVTRKELQAERDIMQKIYDRVTDTIRKGFTWEDMLKAGILNDLGRTWTDPEKFVYAAHKGHWAHHNTLSHDVV